MIHLDPKIAASEIEFLLSLQLPDGRVSHETMFPNEIKIKRAFKSRLGLALGKAQYDSEGRTHMIDPPSFMISAEKIFGVTGDREWLAKNLPRLEACAHYLTHERDLFGDGLPAVVHPWETGTDSSPCYDQILRLDFRTPLGAPYRGLLYPQMLKHQASLNWDLKKIAAENRFILEDMCFIAIAIRGLVAISRLNQALGNADKAKVFLDQARSMTAAIDRIHWDEQAGLYWSRYDLKSPKFARRTTCASLLPLMTGLIPEDRARRIVKEHILNEDEFLNPYEFPFNAKDEIVKDKVYFEDLLLWRGNCIWTNMNWMMVEGLLAYGFKAEARELTRRTVKMIRHEGFREFYDTRNGQGKGATNFNWPAVVLDMVKMTWPEAAAGA